MLADYVPGPLQLLGDFGQASGGVVPVFQQGQHHGEPSFEFQRQSRIAQMVVGHHRVVAGFLYAKYCHGITSLRRLGNVFIFGGKLAFMPSGCPRVENLWAMAFWLIVEGKAWDFRLLSRQHCGEWCIVYSTCGNV